MKEWEIERGIGGRREGVGARVSCSCRARVYVYVSVCTTRSLIVDGRTTVHIAESSGHEDARSCNGVLRQQPSDATRRVTSPVMTGASTALDGPPSRAPANLRLASRSNRDRVSPRPNLSRRIPKHHVASRSLPCSSAT